MELLAACHRHWSGQLPVMEAVRHEAKRRHVKLVILPAAEAAKELKKHADEVNAILHVTCWQVRGTLQAALHPRRTE